MKKYYAYSINGNNGIVDTWAECQKIVFKTNGAKYKSFESYDQAQRWLDMGAEYSLKTTASEDGIYFDAGTGAGKGVEISVTNKNGKSLLGEVLKTNERGNYWIEKDVTNNFGELLACKYALDIALKRECKKIFGDSNLIIEYWSKGFIKKELPEDTRNLAKEVKDLRYQFEKRGGEIKHISGGSNPADLGFHKN